MPRLVLAFALAGCAAPVVSTTSSAIRGGQNDPGDPAVAAVSVLGLYAYCSASLISHHTILTAGHCVATEMEVDFGSDAYDPTQSIDVARAAVHPMYTAEGAPYDLALMRLASDPDGIAPLLLDGDALDSADLGRPIRHVGYGVTDDATGEDGGTKRTVSYPIDRIDGLLVYSGAPGEQTCTGDSGGPGLVATADGEAIATVVSDGPDCQLSQDGWDDRVDLVMDWIVSTVTAWDAPPTFVVTPPATPGSGGQGSGSQGSGGGSAGQSSGGCSSGGHTPSALVAILALLLTVRSRRDRRVWCVAASRPHRPEA
ncbi:MAG TPA: S1 family peptidase [Kofleriaceae bacterium]|nr:S1 family peptidase [Kofleriaceae bacterium]